jgi:hypothetical protein
MAKGENEKNIRTNNVINQSEQVLPRYKDKRMGVE